MVEEQTDQFRDVMVGRGVEVGAGVEVGIGVGNGVAVSGANTSTCSIGGTVVRADSS